MKSSVTSASLFTAISQFRAGSLVVRTFPTPNINILTDFNFFHDRVAEVVSRGIDIPSSLRYLFAREGIPTEVSDAAIASYFNNITSQADLLDPTRINIFMGDLQRNFDLFARDSPFYRMQAQSTISNLRMREFNHYNFTRNLATNDPRLPLYQADVDRLRGFLSTEFHFEGVVSGDPGLTRLLNNFLNHNISEAEFKDGVRDLYAERFHNVYGFTEEESRQIASGSSWGRFGIKSVNPQLRLSFELSDAFKYDRAIDFVNFARLRDILSEARFSVSSTPTVVERTIFDPHINFNGGIDAFRTSLSGIGYNLDGIRTEVIKTSFLQVGDHFVINPEEMLRFIVAGNEELVSRFLNDAVRADLSIINIGGRNIFSDINLANMTKGQFISEWRNLYGYNGQVPINVNFNFPEMFSGSRVADILTRLNGVPVGDSLNIQYVRENIDAFRGYFPNIDAGVTEDFIRGIRSMDMGEFIRRIEDMRGTQDITLDGSLRADFISRGLFIRSFIDFGAKLGFDVGFLTKISNIFNNSEILHLGGGVVRLADIGEISSSGLWAFILARILNFSNPVSLLIGLGGSALRTTLIALEQGGALKGISQSTMAIADGMNWGVFGAIVGFLIGGPMGALIGGIGTWVAAAALKYFVKINIANFREVFGTSVELPWYLRIGKFAGEGVQRLFEFSSFEQVTSNLATSPIDTLKSLFFQNGIAHGLVSALNFGMAGAFAWGIATALGLVGWLALAIAAAVFVIGVGIDALLRFLHMKTIWEYMAMGLKAGFDWVGRVFFHSLASLGFDMLIGIMFLFFRVDFDLEQFLKSIFIYILSWSIIAGGFFGAGIFGSGSNSNTSDTVNSSPSTSHAIGLLTSPVNGSILNLTSDNVTVKTQNGNVIVIKNINNPYLYIGEGIYKGEVVSTSK